MSSIDFAPIVHPTEAEFSNFLDYIHILEKQFSADYGLVKIVPPPSFKARSLDYDKSIQSLILQGPIEQNIYGKGGIYELLLIQKKSTTIVDYKKKVSCFDVIIHDKKIDEIEALFWKNITFSPPLYGADIKGTLMNTPDEWNLSKLNSLLSKGLNQTISGVNVPYLYVGSWKSMFGWHKEDLDLYAINYLHHGKPKFWYALPVSEGPKLEQFAKKQFPEGFNKCSEFLRHKTTMISPLVLKKADPTLKIHKMIHEPGEFVITFGGAYHAGFNYGFNIAEAVNFATKKWLDVFLKAKSCACLKDCVRIDKEFFYNNLMVSEYKDLPEVKKFGIKIHQKKTQTKNIKKSIIQTKIIHEIKRIIYRKPIRKSRKVKR